MFIDFTTKKFVFISTAIIFCFYMVGVFWSFEPSVIDIKEVIAQDTAANNEIAVSGYATTTALIKVAETLLDKPGGYLSNDVTPPSVFLDNIPSWEFGVLEMTRDLALVMRQGFSRSQSQSIENTYLQAAQPQFNIDSESWALPSAEKEYRKAITSLYAYRAALADSDNNTSKFYTRADNLRDWLNEVQKRLGSYSQRLSASVGREQLNFDLMDDEKAQSDPLNNAASIDLKTSWWQIDNEFYEARGACWALLHFLKAVEIDFSEVLAKKNANMSIKQIIRELEYSQQALWSPMILNGDGFGVVANHSLVMANYISRANAGLIDISELLSKG